MDGSPDYPKYGIWTNSYVETNNDISGPYHANPCIYDRAKMLVGDSSAEQVCFLLSTSDLSLLPADIDSELQPPGNQDVFLIGSLGAVDTSHLSLYSIHVDWSNPQDATITGNNNSQLIAIPAFTPACNGRYQAYCVPEPGGEPLASMGDRLMYRFAYWEDSPLASVEASPPRPLPSQHWLVSHAVTASGGQNAMRWYEFTAPIRAVTVSGLSLFQSGTYAPDSNHRWMGSLARDKADDILMGYSISSDDVYPSIAVGSLLLSRRDSSSPASYRFIPAHCNPIVFSYLTFLVVIDGGAFHARVERSGFWYRSEIRSLPGFSIDCRNDRRGVSSAVLQMIYNHDSPTNTLCGPSLLCRSGSNSASR